MIRHTVPCSRHVLPAPSASIGDSPGWRGGCAQEEEAVQLAKKQLATQKAFDHAKMQKEKERMQQDFAFMEIQIQQKKVRVRSLFPSPSQTVWTPVGV